MEVEHVSDEVCAFALRNTLNEIQNICPDIKNAFVFKEDGEVVAGDANTPENTIVKVINAFDGVFEKADSINGVEGIILEGSKGKVIISSMNGLYLVTVTSDKPDMKYLNTITRVLIPTVLKLVETFNPTSLKNNPPEPEPQINQEVPKFKVEESREQPIEETPANEPRESFESQMKPEPVSPEPPVNQLIVENLGGLLVPTDTVRVDNETLSQWTELYNGKKIEEIEIETFDGKIARCKVKPIKESKYEGKGIVQMPEKVQLMLEIKKGELVRVKPAVD
jgi:predicted regulator of Ras-like GTPase activity (Roadblock/LC7/MglB family)